MNPMTSAKAWTGGLTAGVVYEYLSPVYDWLVSLASKSLEACCSAPMPEAAQGGLSALLVGVTVGVAVHYMPNAQPK
jgi:hypothetical protein